MKQQSLGVWFRHGYTSILTFGRSTATILITISVNHHHKCEPSVCWSLVAVQDGQAITPSERIAARQVLPSLEQQLQQELLAAGVDLQAAAGVEDDGDVQDGEVAETGYVDEKGELKRPWCPQTRILEHREMVSSSGQHGLCVYSPCARILCLMVPLQFQCVHACCSQAVPTSAE